MGLHSSPFVFYCHFLIYFLCFSGRGVTFPLVALDKTDQLAQGSQLLSTEHTVPVLYLQYINCENSYQQIEGNCHTLYLHNNYTSLGCSHCNSKC